MRSRRIGDRKMARLLSALLFSASVCLLTQAQTTPQQADQDLNASYRDAMKELPPASREKLRNAQRAWLMFVEKNSAAMRVAAPALGISRAQCEKIEVSEVENRSVDFSYSRESNAPEETKGQYQRADADLNTVYERCLSTLPPDAKAALREAQRLWLAYRDANRPFGIEFMAGLTVRRADQLSDFYVGSTTMPLSTKSPAKAEPSPPDPFERAR
jgi:uncharacterized protein YecT (DUF1311 family)